MVGSGGGFMLILEAKPGLNGRPVGNFMPPIIPGQSQRPDLQILIDQPLGNGSATVCDTSANPPAGGVPAVDPPTFGPGQHVTDALLDLACRFSAFQPSAPCTLNRFGQESVLTEGGITASGRQFCAIIGTSINFAVGDTTLTAQVRDNQGVLGPRKQIIVRRTQ